MSNGESRTPTPHATAWLIRGGEDAPAHCYLCRTEADVEAALTELLGGDAVFYMTKFRDSDEWAGCELKWKDWEIGYVAITSFPASLLGESETSSSETVTISLGHARLIRQACLPRNPNKCREWDKHLLAAVRAFIAAVEARGG
jgi:hypothetical protein